MLRFIAYGASALLLAGVLLLLVDPLARMALWGSQGHIAEGKFLDVNVGESAISAREKMIRRGLKLVGESDGRNRMGVVHPASFRVELFRDHSWRKGTV